MVSLSRRRRLLPTAGDTIGRDFRLSLYNLCLGHGLLKVHFACSWLPPIRREAPDFFRDFVLNFKGKCNRKIIFEARAVHRKQTCEQNSHTTQISMILKFQYSIQCSRISVYHAGMSNFSRPSRFSRSELLSNFSRPSVSSRHFSSGNFSRLLKVQ